MASIRKYKNGYRAQVYVKGARDSETFRTKREAEAGAFDREEQLRTLPTGESKTLRDALERYRDEVVVGKDGERWERIRIEAFLRDENFPSSKRLSELTPDDFGFWRDCLLKSVSAGSVLRDFSTLSPIMELARREWKWISTNPLKDVRKPREPDHREEIISRVQIKAMLKTMNYRFGVCKSMTNAVGAAFLFALRTGMRAGEICALRWTDVSPGSVKVSGKEAGARKSVAARREVPLVYQASRLVESMRGWDDEYVFGIKSQTLDAFFRRYRSKAGLEGFTFHDARHTAATRIAGKVDVLTLCKIFGWKNTKQALTYYNPKVDDIRQQLEPHRSR